MPALPECVPFKPKTICHAFPSRSASTKAIKTASRNITTNAPEYQSSSVAGVGGGGVTDFDIEGVDFYSSSNYRYHDDEEQSDYFSEHKHCRFNTAGNTLPLKRIMVLETNWPNGSGSSSYVGTWAKTPAGQEQELLDVRNMLLGLPGGDGAGVLWWYPGAVPVTGFTGYQNGVTALFDNTSTHAAEPAIIDPVKNPFAPIRGDFNGDGHFNASDISAMLSALGDLSSYQIKRAFTNPDMQYLADFNGDGVITNADLQGMINALIAGQGSTNPVPEPAAGWLLGVAAVAAYSIRAADARSNQHSAVNLTPTSNFVRLNNDTHLSDSFATRSPFSSQPCANRLQNRPPATISPS